METGRELDSGAQQVATLETCERGAWNEARVGPNGSQTDSDAGFCLLWTSPVRRNAAFQSSYRTLE